MKSKKQLLEIYNNIKGKKEYFTFDDFIRMSKSLLKDIRNEKVVFGLKVSKSGMTRHFNSLHHNAILNALYNDKLSYDAVKVGGCGMDMGWHLLLTCCDMLLTDKEMETPVKRNGTDFARSWNSHCSSYSVL